MAYPAPRNLRTRHAHRLIAANTAQQRFPFALVILTLIPLFTSLCALGIFVFSLVGFLVAMPLLAPTATPTYAQIPVLPTLPVATPTITPSATFTPLPTVTAIPSITPSPTLPIPTPQPTVGIIFSPADCASDMYNCDSPYANDVFAYCMQQGYEDIHNLDGDNDGQACE